VSSKKAKAIAVERQEKLGDAGAGMAGRPRVNLTSLQGAGSGPSRWPFKYHINGTQYEAADLPARNGGVSILERGSSAPARGRVLGAARCSAALGARRRIAHRFWTRVKI